jgi:hypothetical protein
MDQNPIAERLKSLHTAAIDARNGYEAGRTDAHGQGMTPLFQEMIVIHTRNEADLSAALGRMGEVADDQGSFMSAVNETILAVRSWFGGLGESVLPGLIDGEMRDIAQYDHGLALPDLPPDVRDVLTTNRDRLIGAIEEMRALSPAGA